MAPEVTTHLSQLVQVVELRLVRIADLANDVVPLLIGPTRNPHDQVATWKFDDVGIVNQCPNRKPVRTQPRRRELIVRKVRPTLHLFD